MIEVVFLVLALATVVRSNDTSRANLSNSMPIAMIRPFSSGVGCSTLPALQPGIAEAVAKIQRDKVSRVRIVGVADAMPISARQENEFGNDVGLALARARCVAGWLTDSLATQGMHVEMTLAVRDPTDRSAEARRNGNPADRIVQIYATEGPL
jgi:hypothetical protein